MQVVAFSTPGRPQWRWRIVDYSGGPVEESHEAFATIAAAVAQGARRLAEMSVPERPLRLGLPGAPSGRAARIRG
jgi:hypothetical protein